MLCEQLELYANDAVLFFFGYHNSSQKGQLRILKTTKISLRQKCHYVRSVIAAHACKAETSFPKTIIRRKSLQLSEMLLTVSQSRINLHFWRKIRRLEVLKVR